MSQPRNNKSHKQDNISHEGETQEIARRIAFARRLRFRIDEMGLKDADIARLSGLRTSALSRYKNGQSFPSSEQLFPLSDALGVDPRWLISGEESRGAAALTAADQADFEWVPRFDLRDVRDDGKGDRIDETPIRKDWLAQRLGTSSELWLTAILSDYPALDLAEGDLVFCREAEPQELLNGQLILWRINQGIIVARYSVASGAGQITMDGDNVVTAREVSPEQYVPIARILGKFMQRF